MSGRRPGSPQRPLGEQAEKHGLAWLKAQGYVLVEQNFRCRHGELDLIMRDGDCLVIVEIRCRARRSPVSAALTVDCHKQKRLIRATRIFLANQPQLALLPVRFDVLAYDCAPGRGVTPTHIRDAFRPQ